MESLIVLSVLVSITIAAPALPGDSFDVFGKVGTDILELTAREKKSPIPGSNDFIEVPDHKTISNGHTLDFAASTGTGRSFGIKKPIIVKKKVGYHLYRDSDEEKEQADSRESCKERVKVKLCNDNTVTKSTDMLRSTVIEDIADHNMSKDEMTHSLKMAKEAIENLERDLNKSHKSGMTAENKNENLDSDTVIHKDIDAARQALAHIHRNFENIDSMSLHATSSKDAESLHNVHLTIAKTEKERMAQWKEAIDNIEKNEEIARNIEDSFKSNSQGLPSNESDLPVGMNIDNIKENSDHQKIFAKEGNMQTMKNTELNQDKVHSEKQCKSKSASEEVIQKNANRDVNIEDDMHSSASSVSETKLNDLNNEKEMRSVTENTKLIKLASENPTKPLKNLVNHIVESKNDLTDHNPQARHSEVDSKTDQKFNPAQFEHDQSMNTDKDKTIRKPNEQSTPLMKNSENKFDAVMTPSTGEIKSATPNEADNTMECNDNLDKKLKNGKSTLHNSEDSNHKSNLNAGQLKHTNGLNDLQKSIEHSDEKLKMTQKDAFLEIENKEIETSNMPMKAFDNFETSFQESMGQSEDFMRTKSDHSDNLQALPSELKPLHAQTNVEMESAGRTNAGQSKEPTSLQWHQDKTPKVHTTSLKAVNEIKKDFRSMDQPANTHISDSHHMTGSGAHGHMHHMLQPESRIHDHVFHNMDKTMPTMNMRDATGNFGAENNMFRWKPNHESARTAYGPAMAPAASTGSSAVGMFPNANVGSCAVPLLLSCSPSVTQGNLAKALPVGYGAPAYRTEDDFSIIPNKRETKKTNDIPGAMSEKVLMNLKEKPTTDNKQ